MDLPILGTIDFTPTGVFLFVAATVAVVYFGWQLFGIGRAGRDASKADETAQASDDASAAEANGGDGEATDEEGSSQKP